MNKKTVLQLIIIAFLGLGLGYLISNALTSKVKPSQTSLPQTVKQPVQQIKESPDRPGIIAVEFENPEITLDQEVKANFSLDTQGKEINGFELVLQFDSSAWQITSPQVEIEPNSPFSTHPLNNIDYQTGLIKFSGLTEIGQSAFSGQAVVGSLLLKPQKTGSLKLEVVFEKPGDINDSDLAEAKTAEDILGKVVNGEINVQ